MQTPKPRGFFTTAREAACVVGLIAISAFSSPAQAENASNCARYGADYVAVSGSSNCVRVGGHVRVNNLPRNSGAPLAYAPDQKGLYQTAAAGSQLQLLAPFALLNEILPR